MGDNPEMGIGVLILACGNPLRGDDGVGPVVARKVESALTEDEHKRHRVIITHQLLPELALALSQADRAVLIDARVADAEPPGVVHIEQVEPERRVSADSGETGLTHHWTLPRLLAVSEALYGRAPDARIVSVTAASFDGADTLSEPVRLVMLKMIDHVLAIVRDRA